MGDWWENSRFEADFRAAKRKNKKRQPDLIGYLFSDLYSVERKKITDPIDRYFDGQLVAARRRVVQISKEMKVRRRLASRFRKEIDQQIGYAATTLGWLSGWAVGYNTGIDVRRNHLERELERLRAERRSAIERAWSDVVRLRKDLREAVEEYAGKRSVFHDM